MPLVLVTGLPSSGKSTTAREIAASFEKRLQDAKSDKKVKIVTDGDQLDWEGRNNVYNSIQQEKDLRGWVKSTAQRFINFDQQIVILDAALYIKGFRYELYCMTKEARGQYCVVEKFLDPEICWRWNEQLIGKSKSISEETSGEIEPGYTRETFDALLMRYEKCDDKNRWETPLFRLTSPEEKLDHDELYKAIMDSDPLIPNRCHEVMTTSVPAFKSDK